MIFCSDERPSENSPVKAFVPEQLPFQMIFSTALEAIRKSDVPPGEISLGIIDPCAVLSHRLREAVDCAGSVRVVTDREECYATAAEMVNKECGAAVPIGDDTAKMKSCDVIICADSALLAEPADEVVFSAGDSGLNLCVNEKIRYPGQMKLPVEYAGLLPHGAAPDIFAAALYELCGVGRLESLTYINLMRNGYVESIYAASQEIYKQIKC